MEEHTPTPWELRGAATLRGADGDYIATLENNGRRSANAAFIVRAANCHAELVRALDDLVEAVKTHYGVGNHETVLGICRDEADAILAKARGEK
jgi:hypothetical protein